MQLDLNFLPAENHNDQPLYIRGLTTKPDGTQFLWDGWRHRDEPDATAGHIDQRSQGWSSITLIVADPIAGTVSEPDGSRPLTPIETDWFRRHFSRLFRLAEIITQKHPLNPKAGQARRQTKPTKPNPDHAGCSGMFEK